MDKRFGAYRSAPEPHCPTITRCRGRPCSSAPSVILGAVLAVGVFGLGVAAWVILAGAFCVLMMGSMIWMMVAMGKHATHRR